MRDLEQLQNLLLNSPGGWQIFMADAALGLEPDAHAATRAKLDRALDSADAIRSALDRAEGLDADQIKALIENDKKRRDAQDEEEERMFRRAVKMAKEAHDGL